MPSVRDTMKVMNDLPNTAQTGAGNNQISNNASNPDFAKATSGNPINQSNTNTQAIGGSVSGVGGKEQAPEFVPSSELPLRPAAPEVMLPKEVVSVGVKVTPTTVQIPLPVSQMGVTPAGPNAPVAQTTTVVLPLTDDQIALGLKQGVSNSVRWLAEWCVRQVKRIRKKSL